MALMMAIDAILVNAAVLTSFYIRYGGEPPDRNIKAYLDIFIFLTFIRVICIYAADLYEPALRRYSSLDIVWRVGLSSAAGTVLTVLAAFYNRAFAFPRTIVVLSMFMDALVIASFKVAVNLVMKRTRPPRRILVAGTGQDAMLLAREVQRHSSMDYTVVGFVAEGPFDPSASFPPAGEIAGDIPGLLKSLSEGRPPGEVDEIVVTLDTSHYARVIELVPLALASGIGVKILPNTYEILIGNVEIREVAGIPFIEVTREGLSGWRALAKRLIDLSVSLTALVLLSPLMAAAWVAIKLTSPGPALYVQERVSRPGRNFRLVKFRSMVLDAEKLTGPTMAVEDDPRITPVGRILRRYRIDELPQFWNILTGDMSLVGPRPEREHFVSQFAGRIEAYVQRFQVKPGLTGLAQIHGRYDTSPENKLRYDLVYVNNWSLLLDLKILLLTLKVVVSGKGAV